MPSKEFDALNFAFSGYMFDYNIQSFSYDEKNVRC